MLALYCASRRACVTLLEAEGWYEVVLFKLRTTGIVDSSVYYSIYDQQDRGLDNAFNAGLYEVMFKGTIQAICNTIQDLFEGQDKIYPVSFGLVEDENLIELNYAERSLMDIHHTSCVFMDQCWPKNRCNNVMQKICIVDCNSIPSLKLALANDELNNQFTSNRYSRFHPSTPEIISQALTIGLPDTDSNKDDSNSNAEDFHLGGC